MCVGAGVREKMQTTRQTLVTFCRSALEGTQVLGCKDVVLCSIGGGPVWFSTPTGVLIAEALLHVCLFFLLFALSVLMYVTGGTTFVEIGKLEAFKAADGNPGQ